MNFTSTAQGNDANAEQLNESLYDPHFDCAFDPMKDQMQNVAKVVEKELPEGTGFFVLAFNFGDNSKPAQYVSNAKRAEIAAAMLEFLERNEFPVPEHN